MKTCQFGKSLSHSIYRNRLQFIVAAGLAATCTPNASAQTSWAAPVDGDWYLASNWNPADVPLSPNESAILGLSSAYTVSTPSGAQIQNFKLTISNPLVHLVLGPASSSLPTTIVFGSGGLVNDGLIELMSTDAATRDTRLTFLESTSISGAGHIRLAHAKWSVIERNSNAALVHAAPHLISGAGAVKGVINESTLRADVPGQALAVSYINHNLVQARNGAILICNLTNTGLVDVTDGSLVTGAVNSQGLGMLRAQGAGTRVEKCLISGGFELLDGAVLSTSVAFSNVELNQHLDLDASKPPVAITLEGSGLVDNAGITISRAGVSIHLSVVNSDVSLSGPGETILDHPDARVSSSGAANGHLALHAAGHRISGYGTVRGTGTSNRLTNRGRIEANRPGLELKIHDITNEGELIASGGGILSFPWQSGGGHNVINSGSIIAKAESTVSISLPVIQSASGVILADGGLVDIGGSTTFGGQIGGGTLASSKGGIVRIPPQQQLVEIENVTSSADWSISSGANVMVLGTLTNHGLIRVLPVDALPKGIYFNAVSPLLSGSGVLQLEEPTQARLSAPSYRTFTQSAGHTIRGVGSLEFSGSFLNHGTIAPGLPIGTIKSINLKESPTGVLSFELAGDAPSERDSILNLGALTLDGTLRIRFLDSYTMPPCSEYLCISGGAITGQFATLDAPQMPIGQLSIRYEPGAVTIVYNPADYDNSTFVDSDDFTAFTLDFEAGNDNADINHSGSVDTDDFTAFMQAFEQGC